MSAHRIEAIKNYLRELLRSHDAYGHGIIHAEAVAAHVRRAVPGNHLAEVAALLHDADDRKMFPASVNYENARTALHELFTAEEISTIIALISNCGFSRRDATSDDNEGEIVRWCDELEAIGSAGIRRCADFALHHGHPYHGENTPVAHSVDEAMALASADRLANYRRIGRSASMIDHYYDKLLHIDLTECPNRYVRETAIERRAVMLRFVVAYWETGHASPDIAAWIARWLDSQ